MVFFEFHRTFLGVGRDEGVGAPNPFDGVGCIGVLSIPFLPLRVAETEFELAPDFKPVIINICFCTSPIKLFSSSDG